MKLVVISLVADDDGNDEVVIISTRAVKTTTA
jgi:hypothetical protein